jgi:hypothetical protein
MSLNDYGYKGSDYGYIESLLFSTESNQSRFFRKGPVN